MPDPTTFEVWFTYVSGLNQSLNRDINVLIDSGALSSDTVTAVYNRHLSPNRHLQKLFAVGESLRDEAHLVADLIDTAHSSASTYGDNLQLAMRQIDQLEETRSVNAIISALVASTDEIKRTNAALQAQLKHAEIQVRQLQDSIEILRIESMTDPVTGVANRKLFDLSLRQMIKQAEQADTLLSLVLADIDRFKDFNDQFGHQIGDDVLRLVAFAIKDSVRGGDLVARYGGDEFVVILPRTSVNDALAVGENIRRAVMEKELVRRSTREKLGRMTVSVGIAEYKNGRTAECMIDEADKHLYAAKHNGRNCVIG
ncbi:MAG: GGDEF domain-containing protein [Xanthobacteraceae bacterium]